VAFRLARRGVSRFDAPVRSLSSGGPGLWVCALLLTCFATPALAAKGDCGQPVSDGESPTASDALYNLRFAVNFVDPCELCVCDTDGSGSITATDALIILKAAVGQDVTFECPACSTTTTLEGAGEPAALEGITAAHNEVRAGVGVPPLVWSESLAATAQAWAEQCVDTQAPAGLIDHNPDRSDGHPYYVGENIYGTTGSADAEEAVGLWAAEEADYDYDTNTCNGVCGHYTQVVWSTSEDLGCGIASCPGLQYRNVIVCNYGPGGNTGGRPY
jgi:uncharacterized protein YkwD